MNTTAASSLFADESVDLIFIDAGHKYDDVKADIIHYTPKLKPGSTMLFDDTEEKWPGVMQAVQNCSLAGELIAPSLWCHRKIN
ncbi:class I SAM-dependent methyltransferase [Roseofilum acuticapitatum]|uniref:class I SAM-dependent methyltransferase n=1 Tax=Roseofilum acuticapitatum TaxID=3082945 RepID=UPI003D2F7251